jgi:hypothetical protein
VGGSGERWKRVCVGERWPGVRNGLGKLGGCKVRGERGCQVRG